MTAKTILSLLLALLVAPLADPRPPGQTDVLGLGPLETDEASFARPPTFEWPTERRRISSRFGTRRGRHKGIDIAAYGGDEIRAAADGWVTFSGRARGYGKHVVIRHAAGYESLYAHASRLLVKNRHFVRRGQVIAHVGRTGNARGTHCHFEIRHNDRPVDPLLHLPDDLDEAVTQRAAR